MTKRIYQVIFLMSLLACSKNQNPGPEQLPNPALGIWYSEKDQIGFEVREDTSMQVLLPNWKTGKLVEFGSSANVFRMDFSDSIFLFWGYFDCVFDEPPFFFEEGATNIEGLFNFQDSILILYGFPFLQKYEFKRTTLESAPITIDHSNYSANAILTWENDDFSSETEFSEMEIGMQKAQYAYKLNVREKLVLKLFDKANPCLLQSDNAKSAIYDKLIVDIADFVGVGNYDLSGSLSSYSTGSGLTSHYVPVKTGNVDVLLFDDERGYIKGTFAFYGSYSGLSVEISDGEFELYW